MKSQNGSREKSHNFPEKQTHFNYGCLIMAKKKKLKYVKH